MTWESWVYAIVFVVAMAVESIGINKGDVVNQPGQKDKRRTITANVRWLATGAGWWHVLIRIALLGFFAWAPGHFQLT